MEESNLLYERSEPISLTEHFKIDKKTFDKTGALDIILNYDTPLFMDPKNLFSYKKAEFISADIRIVDFFNKIIRYVSESIKFKDENWKKADKELTFSERLIKGNCLGYTVASTNGNSIGKKLREDIIQTIKKIISQGNIDPRIFETFGLFQNGIGCDRISDLITYVLIDNIREYTKRILGNFDIDRNEYEYNDEYDLPVNPYNNTEILLLPSDVLKPLPHVYEYRYKNNIAGNNEQVRAIINDIIVGVFKKTEKTNRLYKNELYEMMVNNINIREELMSNYIASNSKLYDFDEDREGVISWYKIAKDYTSKFKLELKKENVINVEYNNRIIKSLTMKFKELVEKENLWENLYSKKPIEIKNYNSIRLIYYGIVSMYCKNNNLSNFIAKYNPNDEIFFYVDRENKQKTVIDIRMTSTYRLDGIKNQIKDYMKNANINKVFLMIINTANDKGKKRKTIIDYYNKLTVTVQQKIILVQVDAKPEKQNEIK